MGSSRRTGRGSLGAAVGLVVIKAHHGVEQCGSVTSSDKNRGRAVVPSRTGGGCPCGPYDCGSLRCNFRIETMEVTLCFHCPEPERFLPRSDK